MSIIEIPVKRKYTVEIEYWDCGVDEHHHKTKEVAQRCIDRKLS